MATYSHRTRTQVYQEIALSWPTNVTELEKAIAAARGWIRPGSERDDTFTVTHDDEELMIRWVSRVTLDQPEPSLPNGDD
jgi:predicted phosphohydrolase